MQSKPSAGPRYTIEIHRVTVGWNVKVTHDWSAIYSWRLTRAWAIRAGEREAARWRRADQRRAETERFDLT